MGSVTSSEGMIDTWTWWALEAELFLFLSQRWTLCF